MAYTYGANIQSNPNAAYNLWGSTGPSNPYITQGPGYTPGSYPTNQQQQASLLPMTNNVPRPGFNDTDGTPINTFQTAQQAVDGGDKHYAYVKDHADWRYHTGDYADDGILAGQGKQIGQSDFDYPGRAFTNSTGGNVQVGEASWDSAKELGGKFANALMPFGMNSNPIWAGGYTPTVFGQQLGKGINPLAQAGNAVGAGNLFGGDDNYIPQYTENWTGPGSHTINAFNIAPSEQADMLAEQEMDFWESEDKMNDWYSEPSSTAPANLNTVVTDDSKETEEQWYARNGYY